MSRGKGSKSKGYTNKYGVHITGLEKEKLKLALKRYKQKRRYIANKYPDATPTNYNLSIIDEFRTKSSFTAFIKDLNKFSDTRLKITTTPSGERISVNELNMINAQIKRENRRRARLKKMVDKQQEDIGFFKTDMDKVLRQLDLNKYKSIKTLRNAAERAVLDHTARLAINWKERYLDQLDYNINVALIAGFDPAGDIIDKMNRIKWYVESLDNVDDITLAAYASPAMDITVTSDIIYMQESIDEIYNAWDDFISEL